VSKGDASSKERTPVPVPISSSRTETVEQQKRSSSAGSRVEPIVWGASAPLSPVVLTATERRFKFRGLPQAVGAARRALRQWESHFEPDTFYDLSLCVSELVTNAVQHGEPGGGSEIELVVRRSDQLARAEVREPQADAVASQLPAAMPSSWGMFIVDRVADRWGIDRGEGMVAWCEIDLASDGWSRSTPPIATTLSSLNA
jgi:anti-sigma regulatory factor (Ser/Thr protein kinase)